MIHKKFKSILRYSLILTICISLVLTGLCYIFTGSIIRAFVSSSEAIGYGISFARIILSTCWIYCLFSVFAMVIQAMGKATASMIVNLSRNAYVFIPMMYLLSYLFGMIGIVWAIPVSDIISLIIAAVALKRTVNNSFTESAKAAV